MLSLQDKKKLIFGSIQLPSFLGKSSQEINEIADFALKNALLFEEGGFDGVFIQDTTIGNTSLDTIANLSSITRHVSDNANITIGTQMEADDAKVILAIAKASMLGMVRIKNYVGAMLKSNGIVNGQGTEAYRYKIENKIETKVFADIFNLTGVPLGNLSLEKACKMALQVGADGLIICGNTYEETILLLSKVKELFPDKIVLCGGNATIKNVKSILKIADGVIVSSSLKTNNGWDINKMRAFKENAQI